MRRPLLLAAAFYPCFGLCFGLFLLAAPLGAAKAGKKVAQVAGTIQDDSGAPLADVEVVVTSPDDSSFELTTTTNRKGGFELEIADAGKSYLWRFFKAGHEPLITTLEVTPGKRAEVTITLPADSGPAAVRRRAIEAFNRGVEAFNRGDKAGALTLFQEAVTADPSLAEAQEALAEAALATGDAAAATRAAEALLGLSPENANAKRIRLQAALGGDDEVALAGALAATLGTELAAQAAVELYNRGVAALPGDAAKAAHRFEQAAELDPSLPAPLLGLATLAYNRSDFPAALVALERALVLQPGNVQALRLRYLAAEGAGERQRADEALAAFAAADAAGAARESYGRAEALFKQNDFEAAKELLGRILAADPDHAPAHYTLGLCLLNTNDKAKAKVHLAKAVELAPDSQAGRDAAEMLQYVQ